MSVVKILSALAVVGSASAVSVEVEFPSDVFKSTKSQDGVHLVQADAASDAAKAATAATTATAAAWNPGKFDLGTLSRYHTAMMCYYYFIAIYIEFASATSVGQSGSLEKASTEEWSFERDPKLTFLQKPFEQFHEMSAAAFQPKKHQVAHKAGVPHSHSPLKTRHMEEEEKSMAFLETEKKGDTKAMLGPWLDNLANFHIVLGAWCDLKSSYDAKDNMAIWQNSVKIMWQNTLIYQNWVAIASAYGTEVPANDYLPKYQNGLFLSFAHLWAWNSYTGVTKALSSGFKTPADVWGFTSNMLGHKAAMSLVHIGTFIAMEQYESPSAGIFTAGIQFIKYSFSVDVLWLVFVGYKSSSVTPMAVAPALPMAAKAAKSQ